MPDAPPSRPRYPRYRIDAATFCAWCYRRRVSRLIVSVGFVVVIAGGGFCGCAEPEPVCLGEPGGEDYAEGMIWVIFEVSVDETEAMRIIREEGFATIQINGGNGVKATVDTPVGEECAAVAAFNERPDVDAAGLRYFARLGG